MKKLKINFLVIFSLSFVIFGLFTTKTQAIESCPEGTTDYGTSILCSEQCSGNGGVCVDPDERCCDLSCPTGTNDYGTGIKCANACTTNCSGPDGKCCAVPAASGGGGGIRAGEDVTKEVIDKLNPLIQQQDDPSKGLAEQLSTPGGVLSRFLGVFAFPIAGLILFVMLIWGGIEMMAGSATSKSIDAGKQRVATALGGFLLLFASYWIARILEMMFGISIL